MQCCSHSSTDRHLVPPLHLQEAIMAAPMEHTHSAWTPRAKLAFAVFAIIGAFFLIVEHRAHVLPFLPWLFLAACPLMHVFMHGGHGGHGGQGERKPPGTNDNDPSAVRPERSRDSGLAARGDGNQHDGDRP